MHSPSLMNTYGRLSVTMSRGEGCWLHDVNGETYFDTFCGIACAGLGYSHPALVAAIQAQSQKLIHCSNLYNCDIQDRLAQRLTTISGMDKVFLCNSGAEANEAAIKLARLHGHRKQTDNPAIIVFEDAFHGRTVATLSASGNRKVQAGFEPLLQGFVRAPRGDLSAIETIARSNQHIVAIMLEPVQGEGGVHIMPPAFLRGLRNLCDDHSWLLIFDEVQTGNGRTGSYFAAETFNVQPDILTTAKGLGNGFPIGACLARGKAAEVFTPGTHGSTFGGNALGCAAALAVIDTIEQENLTRRATELGARLLSFFQDQFNGADYVKDVRGLGLMIGIELDSPCPELVALAKSTGLLINVTAERVIRLLPPLNMSDEECDYLAESVARIIKIYAGDDRMQPRGD